MSGPPEDAHGRVDEAAVRALRVRSRPRHGRRRALLEAVIDPAERRHCGSPIPTLARRRSTASTASLPTGPPGSRRGAGDPHGPRGVARRDRPLPLDVPASRRAALAACGNGFCAPGRGRRGHAGVMGSCSSVTHLSGSSGHSRVQLADVSGAAVAVLVDPPGQGLDGCRRDVVHGPVRYMIVAAWRVSGRSVISKPRALPGSALTGRAAWTITPSPSGASS